MDTSNITTPDGRGDVRPGEYSSEQIAARAYELYLARGAADGQDFDDWITAERELSTGPSLGERSTELTRGDRSE
jgi:hypothetical protein